MSSEKFMYAMVLVAVNWVMAFGWWRFAILGPGTLTSTGAMT